MAISPDFMTLCQSQIGLLTQTLGAASVVVYMAKHWAGEQDAELVPILVYPDEGDSARAYPQLTLPGQATPPDDQNPTVLDPYAPSVDLPFSATLIPREQTLSKVLGSRSPALADGPSTGEMGKLVLPLMHDGAVLGFLVTTRFDRPWSDQEHTQVKRVAQTLAIACFMDQQNRWLQRNLQQKQLVQDQQSQGFHDLLHQFRNPLTALRTFGKLLIKRLQAEKDHLSDDNSQKILASIVRESDHLQALLQQFDQTLDAGDRYWQDHPTALPPLRLNATTDDQNTHVVPFDGVRTLDAATEEYDVFEDEDFESQPAGVKDPSVSTAQALLPPTAFGIDLEISPYDLGMILLPLLDSTRAIAQLRNISVYTDLPDQFPQVNINPQALEEVLNNLLENALKYSPEGAWLYVRAGFPKSEPNSKAYGVLIADGGPGIPTQDLDHIFDRHYRGIQAHSNIPGSGLGLAIAQDLVIRMAGETAVFSPVATCPYIPRERLQVLTQALHNQGSGTAFLVWLPNSL
ncbi:MAG: ATP-binding protein [Cyanobacteria bacterium J06639_16]